MLGMRLFDTDVLDQKGAGKVVLHLDQSFGEKLREIVDERVDMMDPSYLPVHLRFPEVSRRSFDQGGGRLFPHLSDREHPYRKGACRALAMDGRGFRPGSAADAGPGGGRDSSL